MLVLVIYCILISFVFGIMIYPYFISILKKYKVRQNIRLEGPTTHYEKKNTPSMGGIIIILIGIITFYLTISIFKNEYKLNIVNYEVILLFLPLISFGLIGFIDDLLKRDKEGLSPTLKFILQVLFSCLYFYFYLKLDMETTLNIFSFKIDLKGLYGVLILLILVSSSNAVNLTDGLDGLASGLLIISFLSFGVIALLVNNITIFIFTLVISGAILSFLIFNFYPSKIMMGDTGSLALGATLGSVAILLKKEVILLVIGMVFILETLSVILQVSYYKKTRGKRIFKMTPLHHHFELSGWSEKKIDLLFYFVGLLFGILGIILGGVIK